MASLPDIGRLELGEVVLRPPAPRDAGAFSAITRDPLMRAHGGMEERSVDVARKLLAAGFDDSIGGVVCVGDDQAMGNVVIHHISEFDRRAEIGFWLLPEARGRGLARLAVGAMCDWAFEHLGLARLQAFTDVDNVPSQGVLDSCGFGQEARLASYGSRDDGSRVDAFVYARLA